MVDLSFYKDKRVLVTGATGLIGGYVTKLLCKADAEVTAVRHKRPISFSEDEGGVDAILDEDLTWPSPEFEETCHDVDVVLSCAGITGGIGVTRVDPLSYVGPATVITTNTLHAAATAGVKHFGFLSSTTVYSARDIPCKEDDLGEAPYPLYRGIGESKRFLEKLIGYYAEKTGMKVGIVRPSGAYGRGDNFDERTSHVIPAMIVRALKLKNGDYFEVWGDGSDVRDFIHAEDVARGLLLATVEGSGRPFNIASGQGATTTALADYVLRACGKSALIVPRPDKPTALKTRLVDVTLAREALGFEPKISLADGLADTVAWLRETQSV